MKSPIEHQYRNEGIQELVRSYKPMLHSVSSDLANRASRIVRGLEPWVLREKVDVSCLDDDARRALIASNKAMMSDDVNVVYAGCGTGVTVPYSIFTKYFEHFWYPSSDDVLVFKEDETFLVHLDHEECFWLWALQPPA